MKKIIDECWKSCEAPADIVKLRLRGQGSGYKEGHLKRESNEPLHLCVSSEYYDKFAIACVEAEKLLSKIYKEFDAFCRKNHQRPLNLQIKKILNIPAKAIDSSIEQEDIKEETSS